MINEFLKNHNSSALVEEGYGLTESISVVIVNTHDHNKLGSIGYPSSGIDVKILDENNNEVPRGEIGEICIKSLTNMLGYFKDEEATKAAIIDGYLHTGDLGYINDDGVLFFVQRLKRLIIVSGYNVFPSHIEDVLNKNEYILNSCVVGIPDP